MKECMARILKDLRQYAPVLAAMGITMLLMRLVFHAGCPSVIVFGLPCPGCGITRAALLLAGGHPIRAFEMNPSIYVWLLFFLYLGWFRYVRGKQAPHLQLVLCMVIVLVIGIYVGGMWRFFPKKIPYTIKYDNILSRIFPLYGELLKR